MTDIGEAIAVTMIKPTQDGPCWFCSEQPVAEKLENDEDADPDHSDNEDEDGVAENDEKNDASKLGKNLLKRDNGPDEEKPFWNIQCPLNDKGVPVMAAAHHCIPGNASYKVAKIKKYTKDTGYSINHKNNGLWLPGNYYVRKDKPEYKKNWGGYDDDFKNNYAILAVQRSGLQFHDAHADYSLNVKNTLNSAADKLRKKEKQDSGKCPVCGGEMNDKPHYGMVGRLDFVSMEHKKMLENVGESGEKNVKNGYRTSNRMLAYYKKR